MHYIYDTNDNNRLESIASALPEKLRDGFKSVWLEGKGTWNRETLSLDPLPVRRRIKKADFGALLTDHELACVFALEESEQTVSVFLRRLDFFGYVDLADESAKTFLGLLVSRGALTQERAEAIAGV